VQPGRQGTWLLKWRETGTGLIWKEEGEGVGIVLGKGTHLGLGIGSRGAAGTARVHGT